MMNKRMFLLMGALLIFSHLLLAQEDNIIAKKPNLLHIGFEAGVGTIFGDTDKPTMIRENQYHYYYDYNYYGSVFNFQESTLYYFGVKPEYTINKRFAVAAGLRLSISKSTLYSDRDYYLWKISETGINTHYVSIESIDQNNFFIGVPMEIRYFTRSRDSFVRHYFVFGASLMFLMASTNNVSFIFPDMNKYRNEINAQLDKPDFFQGYIHIGTGLKIGKSSRPHAYAEFFVPIMVGGGKMNSFTQTYGAAGFGINVTLRIPFYID